MNELREISPKVAEIGLVNPYTVPAGYFEGLAEIILQRVQHGDEIATVIDITRNNPYEVPKNYFETLPEILLKKVKAQNTDSAKEELEVLSPLLSQIGKKTPFSTPAGYFDELTDNAVAGAKAIDFVNDELENLSPVMNGLKEKKVYEVPAGYFNNLPAQILDKVKTQQPAKVVSMSFGRKVMKYAVAAVVAGIIVIGGWLYIGNDKRATDLPVAEVKVPALIHDSVTNISDEVLQSFLEGEDVAMSTPVITASDEIGANDMKDMLADISDAELEKYIDQSSM